MVCCIKFLSSDVVLYLRKSANSLAWNTVVNLGWCFWWVFNCSFMLDKLQKWTLSLSRGISLVDVYLNLVNWLHLAILVVGPIIIEKGCIIFLPLILDVPRRTMWTVSFLAQLHSWTKCFKQSKEIKKNWTGPENLNICLCVTFDCYCQGFISGSEIGR